MYLLVYKYRHTKFRRMVDQCNILQVSANLCAYEYRLLNKWFPFLGRYIQIFWRLYIDDLTIIISVLKLLWEHVMEPIQDKLNSTTKNL